MGTSEALRWTVGGLRVAWRERRARVAAQSRIRRVTRRLVIAAVLAVLAAFPVRAYVATVSYQASESMAPGLRAGDRVLVDRVSFHLTGLHRGDVVLVRQPNPDGRTVPVIRRVIGLPGDRIECVGGAVRRNGTQVTEAYLAPGSRTDCAATTVGAGQLFLLGDDREVARDSREVGTVPAGAVLGRVAAHL